jgi:hypothetical protein
MENDDGIISFGFMTIMMVLKPSGVVLLNPKIYYYRQVPCNRGQVL